MTEAEWLACEDPTKMLLSLKRRGTQRKIRLFSVACCRRIWHLIADDRSRDGVTVADRFVDGQATSEELQAAEEAANAAWLSNAADAAAFACLQVCAKTVSRHHVSTSALAAFVKSLPEANVRGMDDPLFARRQGICPPEEAEQCRLIRDVFGNPFRKVKLDTRCRTDTALALARQIYESRDFSAMPILADAVEDAGCADADLLSHLRSPGPHVRGCWALDLILGKE